MRWLTWIVVLLLMAGGGWYWYVHANANKPAETAGKAPKAGRPQAPAILVTTTHVTSEDVPIFLDGLGTVQAYKSVTVRSQIDGQLDKILFTEGQDVKAGDIIAEIDDRPLKAQLEQARAHQRQDEAKELQDRAKLTADLAKIKQDEAKKNQDIAKKAIDQANVNNARIKGQRFADMVKAGAGTEQDADDQRSVVEQLLATLKGDDAAIEADDAAIATDQALMKADEATVEADRATVEADKAAVRYQETQLAYTVIRSPIDGKTGVRQIDAGNIVHANDLEGIVVITQLQPISVTFTLPQQDLVRVNRSMAAGTLTLLAVEEDNRTEIERGKLDLVDNAIDPNTGTIKLKATFPNAKRRLWPGGFINIRLIVETRSNALLVAQQAVQQGPEKAYVYVVKPEVLPPLPPPASKGDAKASKPEAKGEKPDGKSPDGPKKARPEFEVELRNIDVALFQDDRALIKSGVRPGEQVVLTGQDRLKNGARVSIFAPREPKGGKPAAEMSLEEKTAEPATTAGLGENK